MTGLTKNQIKADLFASVESIQAGLAAEGYIASAAIATAVYVAHHLQKPVLIEGPAGVGKTELAKTLSACLSQALVRLQCYEGLDESKALYEWKYGKQLLYTQLLKEKLGDVLQSAQGLSESMQRLHGVSDEFYAEEFLQPRPLLQAISNPQGAVLLVDEIDKADYEFESLLLEILSDYQVTVPELGTVSATTVPLVFLTSNNTRELSDALKRRCLHLYIDFPDAELERRIITSRVPGISATLTQSLVAFVQSLRSIDLKKSPSVSETIDWANALLLLHADKLDRATVENTLNLLLKFQEDIAVVSDDLPGLIKSSQATVRNSANTSGE